MKFLQRILTLATTCFLVIACNGIDCSLDSVVVWTMTFYDSETKTELKLPYVLTIEGKGAGTLYNQATRVSSIELPMSMTADADTLYLQWRYAASNEENGTSPADASDVLIVGHTNYGHYDAMDCPAAVFHDITETELTRHAEDDFPLQIDSVKIIRQKVDYQDVENVRLYLRQD